LLKEESNESEMYQTAIGGTESRGSGGLPGQFKNALKDKVHGAADKSSEGKKRQVQFGD